MATNRKNIQNRVSISVLQNGREVASSCFLYGKKHTVRLSNHKKNALYIPQYPLADDLEILKSSKKSTQLVTSSLLKGFIVKDIDQYNIEKIVDKKILNLRPKDMVSLYINDLQILIKIDKQKIEKSVISKKYKSYSLIDFWLGDTYVKKSLAIAIFSVIIMYGGFIMGLLYKPDTRPKSFSDLKPEYIIPFIGQSHIETLPEAVQKHIKREAPLEQVLEHYTSLTKLLMGFNIKPPKWIFPSTVSTYNTLYKNQLTQAENIILDNYELRKNLDLAPSSGTISIPLVKSESYEQKILRSMDTLKKYQISLSKNLEHRYKLINDPSLQNSYDFLQYKNIPTNSAAEILAARTFDPSKGEKDMYLEYKTLANKAKSEQQKIEKLRNPLIEANWDNIEPLFIDPKITSASFELEGFFSDLDKKYIVISASTFDPYKNIKVKEPVVGTINPNRIRSAVQSRQYQIQLCYENALRKDLNLKGSMEWEWILDTLGKISEISLVESSIFDKEMIHCIKSKIARWRLPKPKNGSVRIRFPFSFTKGKG